MAKLTEESKQELIDRVEKFNNENFKKNKGIFYILEFKTKFVYLKRVEGEHLSPIARLTFDGDINKMDFAIYKWSRDQYDADEFMFPGYELTDGTIEGAMKAGNVAYPV